MKILHFSDIHTGGRLSSIKSLFDKRVIGTINYKLRRKHHVKWNRLENALAVVEKEKPDVVINTGDLTSVSEPAEFDEAMERLQRLTDNSSFTFLNVPGNHDYYVNRPEILAYRNKTYNSLNRGLYPIEEFPQKVETENIIFIMVDESRPNGGTNSSGHFKEKDLEKISIWIDSAMSKKVILVGHYPLRNRLGQTLAARRALENGELLYEMLEKGKISVTLCGHIHAPFSRREKSGSLEVCAGSLTIGGRMNKLEYDCSTEEFSQSWIELN
jgi:3',5'-cyclic AMP phosphodiesterase CpdA